MDPVVFPGGHVYEMIVTSHSVDDATKQWRNVMAIRQTSGVPAFDDPITDAWLTTLQKLQFSDSEVDKVELRVWQRGDIPFDEQGYVWLHEGLGFIGEAETTFSFSDTTPCDGDICMLIHKQQTAAGGRVGKLYLHNNVRQEMLTMVVGGKPHLTAPTYTAYPGLVAGVLNGAPMDAYLGVDADPGFVTVHWSKKTAGTPFLTIISDLDAVGVTEHQLGRHNG